MKNFNSIKYTCILVILSAFAQSTATAQDNYMPYNFDFYQKFNGQLYSTSTAEHTALKPFFVIDSALRPRYDSLMNYGVDGKQHSGGYQKLFNQHLIDSKTNNSTFYADLLPDFSVGRNFSGSQNTDMTSLGFQLGGSVGSKFFYNVSGYFGEAMFPEYLNTYIQQVGIVPGEAYNRTPGGNPEWYYFTGVASYTASKYLTVEAGRDKTFIGDGYRSLLLSDYASPYPFFRAIGTLGPLRYMAMWTDMNDPATTSQYGINRNKFGVFHYLDWTATNRLSIGLFENITGFFTDDNGVSRPFDFNYINPIIFMKPINNSSNDPDKSLIGLNVKYKISDGVTIYGQFALDEFHEADFFSDDGAFDNKNGWQLGLRGSHLFGVKDLNFILESNNVKPYVYQARSAIENYSDNGEPLAQPWGANFREVVGILSYSYGRFNFSGETDLGKYGFDINGLNEGKDIYELYTDYAQEYGNYIGQGLKTNLVYLQGKVDYLINPKYNLRLEVVGIYRTETNSEFNDHTTWLTVGLTSSFRDIYYDISSFKPH